ncbi:MAG: response regulator transcription factor [Sphingobacteriales bacterium]|nr:response regulator transcription factor [Sphingobacteriales bacterium]
MQKKDNAELRILIADDHAIVRRGISQLLLEEYPAVFIGEAGTAEELLKMVMQKKWSLVICDINMPGRSGIDALQQIKQMEPSLPVLIMSMYSEDQYAMRAFKAGAAGYLGKETVHFNLINAIKTVLSGRKFITHSIAEKMVSSLETANRELPHEYLSNREFEVMKLLASGKSVSAIAESLSVSITTVSTYRSRILEKMNMKSNAELVRYALEQKLI